MKKMTTRPTLMMTRKSGVLKSVRYARSGEAARTGPRPITDPFQRQQARRRLGTLTLLILGLIFVAKATTSQATLGGPHSQQTFASSAGKSVIGRIAAPLISSLQAEGPPKQSSSRSDKYDLLIQMKNDVACSVKYTANLPTYLYQVENASKNTKKNRVKKSLFNHLGFWK